jgi:hypothetical protein
VEKNLKEEQCSLPSVVGGVDLCASFDQQSHHAGVALENKAERKPSGKRKKKNIRQTLMALTCKGVSPLALRLCTLPRITSSSDFFIANASCWRSVSMLGRLPTRATDPSCRFRRLNRSD